MIDRGQAGQILFEMVETSRTFQVSAQASGAKGLTGTKFGVLQNLRHCGARLGGLAERLGVSAPVASRAVDALEAEGLVGRRTDPEDGRACLISITNRGRVYLAEREGSVVDRFAAALADWSPGDADQAISILRRLNAHLSEVTAPPTPEARATDDIIHHH